MKIQLDIEIPDGIYHTLEKIAKKVCLGDAKELLKQELKESLENAEIWIERASME